MDSVDAVKEDQALTKAVRREAAQPPIHPCNCLLSQADPKWHAIETVVFRGQTRALHLGLVNADLSDQPSE